MFPKFYKTECVRLRQVLPTIRVHRFGKAKNMGENVMFGQLDVYSTRCAHYILLSEPKISQAYIEKLLLATMTQSLQLIPNNWAN